MVNIKFVLHRTKCVTLDEWRTGASKKKESTEIINTSVYRKFHNTE